MYLHVDLFGNDHIITELFGGKRITTHHKTYSEVIEKIQDFAKSWTPYIIPVRLIDRDLDFRSIDYTTHESAIKYIHDTRTPFPRYEEYTA